MLYDRVIAVIAVIIGDTLLVLNRVEAATRGGGVHGRFFDPMWIRSSAPAVVWPAMTIGLLAAFLLGMLVGSFWCHWDTRTLVVGAPAVMLLGGGLGALATWRHWWHSIWVWITGMALPVATGWLALAAVVCATATLPDPATGACLRTRMTGGAPDRCVDRLRRKVRSSVRLAV